MAILHEVPVISREEMLIGFAKAFGRYMPRPPIPAWWIEFESFYQDVRAELDDRSLILATEAIEYEDSDDLRS